MIKDELRGKIAQVIKELDNDGIYYMSKYLDDIEALIDAYRPALDVEAVVKVLNLYNEEVHEDPDYQLDRYGIHDNHFGVVAQAICSTFGAPETESLKTRIRQLEQVIYKLTSNKGIIILNDSVASEKKEETCETRLTKSILAKKIAVGWEKYHCLYGFPPHGTIVQIRSLLELCETGLAE
jgi:hypothetical protein